MTQDAGRWTQATGSGSRKGRGDRVQNPSQARGLEGAVQSTPCDPEPGARVQALVVTCWWDADGTAGGDCGAGSPDAM